jgi:LysM repeat protein
MSLPPMHILMKSLTGAILLLGAMAHGQQNYTIKPGDNLTKIARKHGCTVEALVRENKLKPDAVIRPGQNLVIPGKQVSSPATAAASTPTATGTHTIKEGETFSSIAKRYNIPVEQLLTANPDLDPKALRPGRKIQLGNTRTPATEPAVSTAASARTSDPAPAPENPKPADDTPEPSAAPQAEKIIHIVVDAEITYQDLATKHGTNVARLNQLNGLDLDGTVPLAKGSELYVPQLAPAAGTQP